MADLVMQAAGNLVDVDILELSRFPCHGVDIFCTSIRLVLLIMKEIDLVASIISYWRLRELADKCSDAIRIASSSSL